MFEVVARGVPAGLGTYANWDERLDGLLAWSVMSLQAVKAVEIGRGVTAAESFGSAVHDPIHYAAKDTGKPTRFTRPHNNAGGIEGGVSNGEDIVVRGYLKPISTLRQAARVGSFRHPRDHQRQATSAATFAWCRRREWRPKPWWRSPLRGWCTRSSEATPCCEMKRNYDGYIEQIRSF